MVARRQRATVGVKRRDQAVCIISDITAIVN
jgi:hypothetical protein